MPDRRFDPATHTYWIGDKQVPSVTQITQPLSEDHYAMVKPAVMERKRVFGSEVHKACELHDLGWCNSDGVRHEHLILDADVRRCLQGWKLFVKENECDWIRNEEQLWNETTGHAGTQDRMGTVRRKKRTVMTIVDIKTVATLGAHVGVQLSGYELLEPPGLIELRIAVQLFPDGTYRMKEYPDESVMFRSLLNVHHWKTKHGYH